MLQLRPFLIVREARTHVPGFEPCIASTQAAVGPYLTGRTFVTVIRSGPIGSELEDLPSFFHCAGAEIVARDWEGGAEVHLTIGSNGEPTVATGAFDEGMVGLNRILSDAAIHR